MTNMTQRWGGFAAGTLVHAKEGLVPIEQIKVGDLVLSQPEDGGDLSYKPVTRTCEHDFKEVMLISVALLEGPRSLHTVNQYHCMETGENFGAGKVVPGAIERIIATPNHPFFAKDVIGRKAATDPNPEPKWTKLADIDNSFEVEAINGTTVKVGSVDFIRHAGDPGFGYMPLDPREWADGGLVMDMGAMPLQVKFSKIPPMPEGNSPRVLVTVYNIEVQDNHTYYVGRSGLWVQSGRAAGSLSERLRTSVSHGLRKAFGGASPSS